MSIIQKDLDLPKVDNTLLTNFIQRWKGTNGTERANYQLFLTELCSVLHLPSPEPASKDTNNNAYVFERRVDISSPDGSMNTGFIDLYRRDCFVLEAKQTGKTLGSQGWDKAMLAAHNQADNYVRALSAAEGRPPFIVVTDVGRSLEIYSEFTRTGGAYVPFPDPGHHRIKLENLVKPEIQDRLRRLWVEPDSLDPSKYAARVTREVSIKLADLAKSLESGGYDVERVAHFLKRCLFTMFAEDVALIPEYSFTGLLERLQASPEHFSDSMSALWNTMNTGGFEGQLMHKLPRFNGGLFKGIDPIPLNAYQIQLLIDAAKYDWRYVEPAIFGTLLERALDPRERHKLGAHYTPRAYVERLVMPTLINPLREEWSTVQVAVEAWLQKEAPKKALNELHEFHLHLCQIKVLDPACGSGNFLYVALEHLKRLEGEVLNLISDLRGGQVGFETEGLTIDPHQFLGLEINPRAAAIAEIVLWIGYLQWHYRIHGRLNLPDPILKDFHNIENRDALIEYESREPMRDENSKLITIWDGLSYKSSPVTGELIPDDSQRKVVYHYQNPNQATWPNSDYIIGNPPFIGAATMRRALGDGYVEAVRKVFKGQVPDSADFVMYWWHIAAEKVHQATANQFGFITTNSLRQTFNRRVIESHLGNSKKPLSLVYAIPDHPWVDGTNGAAVRIAMSVGAEGNTVGILQQVVEENESNDEARNVFLNYREGKLFADLTIGANVSGASSLKANCGITSRGVMLFGSGFIIDAATAEKLGTENNGDSENIIRPYRNGRDLVQTSRNVMVIDPFGIELLEFKEKFPRIYHWLLERVKPERDQNKDKAIREKWWMHGRPRPEWRDYSNELTRYISTVETSKHRIFTFLDSSILPDNKLVNIALDNAALFGVLSSRIHIAWSFACGSRLGVGNDPVYVKTKCFEAFPFPELTDSQTKKINDIAEELDAHRKLQQDENPKLKLTDIYNVLEKLRTGELLTNKERITHEQGLISTLKELHDDLDRVVFEVYGWNDLADKLVGLPGATTPLIDKPETQAQAEEELLSRLVELNHQRIAEEAQGLVRWLRPEYQSLDIDQPAINLGVNKPKENTTIKTAKEKQIWPKEMRDQIKVVLEQIQNRPSTEATLAEQFKRKPIKPILQVLSALESLGRIENIEGHWVLI